MLKKLPLVLSALSLVITANLTGIVSLSAQDTPVAQERPVGQDTPVGQDVPVGPDTENTAPLSLLEPDYDARLNKRADNAKDFPNQKTTFEKTTEKSKAVHKQPLAKEQTQKKTTAIESDLSAQISTSQPKPSQVTSSQVTAIQISPDKVSPEQISLYKHPPSEIIKALEADISLLNAVLDAQKNITEDDLKNHTLIPLHLCENSPLKNMCESLRASFSADDDPLSPKQTLPEQASSKALSQNGAAK